MTNQHPRTGFGSADGWGIHVHGFKGHSTNNNPKYQTFHYDHYEQAAIIIRHAVVKLRTMLDECRSSWIEGAMYALNSVATYQALGFQRDNPAFSPLMYEGCCCLHFVPLRSHQRIRYRTIAAAVIEPQESQIIPREEDYSDTITRKQYLMHAEAINKAFHAIKDADDQSHDWNAGALYALMYVLTLQEVAFKEDNPRFNPELYEKACGLDKQSRATLAIFAKSIV